MEMIAKLGKFVSNSPHHKWGFSFLNKRKKNVITFGVHSSKIRINEFLTCNKQISSKTTKPKGEKVHLAIDRCQ